MRRERFGERHPRDGHTDGDQRDEPCAVDHPCDGGEVEIEPEKRAFENNSPNRHKFGVCEVVKMYHSPVGLNVIWRIPGNGFAEAVSHGQGVHSMEMPVSKGYFTKLNAEYQGVQYDAGVSLVEPNGVVCTSATWNEMTKDSRDERKGSAGYVGMYLILFVTPRSVSFENIDFAELPSDGESHTRYYDRLEGTPYISHTQEAGAGVWHHVGSTNYFCRDEAVTSNNPQPWMDESYHVWDIPHGWRRHQAITGIWLPNERVSGRVKDDYHQTFTLDEDGFVTISKYGQIVFRSTNNCVRVGTYDNIVHGED